MELLFLSKCKSSLSALLQQDNPIKILMSRYIFFKKSLIYAFAKIKQATSHFESFFKTSFCILLS